LRRPCQSVSFTGPIHREAPLIIEFDCSCGRALRVRDESLRGRKVKCPACGVLADVPGEPPSSQNQTPPPPPGGKRRRRRPRRRGRRGGGQKGDAAPVDARQEDRGADDQGEGDRPPRRKRRSRKRSSRRNRQGGGPRRDRDGRRRLQPQERQPVEVGGGIPAGTVKPPPEEPKPPAKEAPAGPVTSFFKRLFGR
jgi:hypothetical protein